MELLCRSVGQLALKQRIFVPCVSSVRHHNHYEFSRWRKKYKQPIWRYKLKDKRALIPPDAWAEPLYERHEKIARGEEVVPQTPVMLHLVQRIKTLRGQPHTVKTLMEKLGLDGPLHKMVIKKNEPSVNKELMKVKHLIKIQQITFPYGPPTSDSDLDHTMVKTNGECMVTKEINSSEIPVKFEMDEDRKKWLMDKDTLKRHLQLKQQQFKVGEEYWKEQTVYKYNQDGKEHRYSHNKSQEKIKEHYNMGRPFKGKL
ncbi:unnamed protein product [Owenia fusiformis]|uniref:Large ribosomal subunit protein uL30m n=1 Tax=Owenia fusiformis TaxID=6347 RepID=A0A8S4N7K4_OWEFU|nr:unnamed protein product [Owenia fusiformis]